MGGICGTIAVCSAHGIQRISGWNIIPAISRVLPTTGIVVTSEGVIDISEYVLESGSNMEVVGKGQTAGIVIILVVVVHKSGGGGGARTSRGVGCL